MGIPIQNIYFLLCYAWDKLEERDIVDVDGVGVTELVDLFARILIGGTNHVLKRGFDRSYVEHRETTSRLRGKVQFASIAKTAAVGAVALPCEFDELSYDVLHNQILKASLRRLLRTEAISDDNSEAVSGLLRHLSDVRDIELNGGLFGRVQLHRNNRFYDFLMKVCQLLHYNLLISETPGRSRFRDFSRDPRQMAVLYEAFVRNFYRVHSRYRVKREDIHWTWIADDDVSAGLLPKMQTDVSLWAPDRKIIIDCKYTPEATQHHYNAETLRSAHLYQLHAYLANLPANESECEAILLYPMVDKPLAASYIHGRHRIGIRTIDLHQPWPSIHRDLLGLVA